MNHFSIPIKPPEEKLSQNDMKLLVAKAQNGCKVSRDKLVEYNMKLVFTVMHRLKIKNEQHEDLFQIGIIGLIKAIDNFDLSRGVFFSTYAIPMIYGEIRRFMRDDEIIRVTRKIKDNIRKVLVFKNDFLSEQNREPSMKEIIKNTSLTLKEVNEAFEAMQDCCSISTPVSNSNDDKNLSYEETIADQFDLLEETTKKISLSNAVKKLPKNQQKVIFLRFFKDKNQTEIASELGISQAQISRLEKKAISCIKDYCKDA